MRQVYSNVSKVMIDSRSNSNLLYLPLDKLLQQSNVTSVAPTTPAPSVPETSPSTGSADARSRDNQRGRDRESR
jgi:membrane protease subunit HflK